MGGRFLCSSSLGLYGRVNFYNKYNKGVAKATPVWYFDENVSGKAKMWDFLSLDLQIYVNICTHYQCLKKYYEIF